MHHTARRALLATLIAGAAVPAIGHGAAPTLRIEGTGSTLLPETAVPIATAPVTARDAGDADTVTVPGASATAQLATGAAAANLPIGFSLFDFGTGPSSFITRIGGETMPVSGSPSWRLTVNHTASQTGADTTTIADGDHVLWAFVTNFEQRELDIALSRDLVREGEPFEVAVTSNATDGTARPAAGAAVVYAGRTATTGATGRVAFTAVGTGNQAVVATKADEVRSPSRAVCSVTTDASVCGLPSPAPAPAVVAAPTTVTTPQGSIDRVAPGSRIGFPRIAAANRRVRGITGVAGPDRSDVAGVQVALARRVGTQCSFLGANHRLAAPTACTGRVWLRARMAGGNWVLPLGRQLAPGLWRVWSRATDGAGNLETAGIARVNTGQFRVIR